MEMWQRFTPRARRAVLIAHDEASQMHMAVIGTEHLLLGLIGLGEGAAAGVLRALDVNLEQLRSDLRRHMEMGSEDQLTDRISFTPEAQRVLQLAYAQARERNDAHIGTEHLLLGLVSKGRGLALRVLDGHHVDLRRVQQVLDQEGWHRPDEDVAETSRQTSELEYLDASPEHGRAPDPAALTPVVRHVLELAATSARQLGDEHVGTEHILFGLLSLDDCVASRVLDAHRVDRDSLKQAISRRQE